MPKKTGYFIKGATAKQQMSASNKANKRLITSLFTNVTNALKKSRVSKRKRK